ncbi:hypothetical protein LPJ56_004774 [Coemansia sp. RSA 2599]|nr:hypothetical protein LPJ56_004774 [Coemansia sp. RSA 2599]
MRPDKNRQIVNRAQQSAGLSSAAASTGTTENDDSEDLINLDGDEELEEFEAAKREIDLECEDIRRNTQKPPPVPPKPAALASRSIGSVESLSNSAQSPPPVPPKPASLSGQQRAADVPLKPPRRPANAVPADSGSMPGGWNAANASGTGTGTGTGVGAGGDRPPLAGPASTASSMAMPGAGADAGLTAAERFEARVNQLREHAQEWMAFYAQRFYVAPTQSFLRYAHVFMPTVEQDMRIIDYEAVPHELHNQHQQLQLQQQQQQEAAAAAAASGRTMSQAVTFDLGDKPYPAAQQQHWAGAPTPQSSSRSNSGYNTPLGLGASRTGSFATFSIPEPPPVEAQLARNARRLLLWKRYLSTTKDLPPNMCRLFVDASDIKQDTELTDVLFPKFANTPQL